MTAMISETPPTIPDYLSALNDVQQKAVETLDGPVLVLAGAGTGKTRVLTTRIAHLLMTKRAFAGQVLAVTFTNKAAREMVERVQHLLIGGHEMDGMTRADSTQGMWLGTFHSIGARILRRHAEALGLTSTFTILDTDDQIRLIKQVMAEQDMDPKQFAPKTMLDIIQSWKDRGLLPDKVDHDQSGGGYGETALKIYQTYQRRLRELNACDFGDLLLHNLTLFQKHPEILQEYSNRFRYILVDEYQDTNIAQYLWLRMLAIGHKNICCVGDDDQSIYGWRGAEVGNILKFEKDFPGAEVVRLEQNYRSTKPILAAASVVIDNNQSRLGKTLWTESDGGDPVKVKSVWDEQEEARFVGEEIEATQRKDVRLNEMAVLVRAGFQTRSFEERFLTLGVPYRVIGGLRFYERMEIRDAIAYLRIITQPRDDLAFERIINTPKRGIGKATLEQLHVYARANNVSLLEATSRLLEQHALKGKAAGSLQRFVADCERWGRLAGELTPAELCAQALEDAGYLEMWRAENTLESQGRLENLQELSRALDEFESVTEFLEHVGLVMDADTTADDDMVSIMTLHAAKGLEFDTVFLTGWEEGLFPHQRSLDESGSKGLEEERRLAYVGITRAKRQLFISHAANRRIYGQWQSSIPSRFLDELPDEHIDVLDGGPSSRSKQTPSFFQNQIENIMAESTRRESSSSSAGKKLLGKRVFHIKFGYGKVISENGDHLEISFEKAGKKKVMADYVEKA